MNTNNRDPFTKNLPLRNRSMSGFPKMNNCLGEVLTLVLKFLLFVFLLYVSSSEAAWADQLDDGSAAYDKGNYTTALEVWKPLAAHGNNVAQFLVGWLYESGKGVGRNDAEALRWYSMSAEKGNHDAEAKVGEYYESGYAGQTSYSDALKWFQKSADQGNAVAEFHLGAMYQDGKGVTKDNAEAFKWFEKSADQGNSTAQYKLGLMYQNGDGVQQDSSEALRLYKLSVAQDDAPKEAKDNLASLEASLQADRDKANSTEGVSNNVATNSEASLNLDEAIGEIDGWKIGFNTANKSCIITAIYEGDTQIWIGIKGDKPTYFIAFANPNWKSIDPDKQYKIRIRYGRRILDGMLKGFDAGQSKGLRGDDIPWDFIRDFSTSNSIEISYNRKSLAHLNLDRSSAALDNP